MGVSGCGCRTRCTYGADDKFGDLYNPEYTPETYGQAQPASFANEAAEVRLNNCFGAGLAALPAAGVAASDPAVLMAAAAAADGPATLSATATGAAAQAQPPAGAVTGGGPAPLRLWLLPAGVKCGSRLSPRRPWR